MRLFFCLIFGGWLILATISSSCDRISGHSAPGDCPPCPNNTSCLDGDCGCTTDQHDMGSWCLDKHDQLFVAASLESPCLRVLGLYLWNMVPETGNGSLPQSVYSLAGQGDSNSNGLQGNYSFYERPDGDSIVLYNIPGPGLLGFYTCKMNDSLFCEIDLFGKFHGSDTIQARLVYRRCENGEGDVVNYSESHNLTFIRKN